MSKSETVGLCNLPPETTMNGGRYGELLRVKLEQHMCIRQCAIFMVSRTGSTEFSELDQHKIGLAEEEPGVEPN